MSLRVETNLASGVPQTAVAGFAPRGKAWHWTAGGTGRAGALATIQHFVNTRLTVNASYHLLFWHLCTDHVTGAMWIVHPTKASHSMNPANAFVAKTGTAREKERFAEVHRILARDSDPNADSISISFCGMPADLAKAAACPVFRADIRSLDAQISAAVPSLIERPHFGHGWIQPVSRYETDATTGGADLLIAPILYTEETDMPTPKLDYVPQLWKAKASGAPLREQADRSVSPVATVPAGGIIFTVGEAPGTDEGWRVAVAGDPERLLYVEREHMDALPPTPRDLELYAGIAAVVDARIAGKPVPTGSGVSKEDYDAALAQVSALTKRIGTKDTHIASYPKG